MAEVEAFESLWDAAGFQVPQSAWCLPTLIDIYLSLLTSIFPKSNENSTPNPLILVFKNHLFLLVNFYWFLLILSKIKFTTDYCRVCCKILAVVLQGWIFCRGRIFSQKNQLILEDIFAFVPFTRWNIYDTINILNSEEFNT